jgi:transposase
LSARSGRKKLTSDITRVIDPLLATVDVTDAQLAIIEQQLATLCVQEPIIAAMTTTPGVGTVVAATFMSVVDEAKRFQSAHQIESYVGVVPSEDSSGGKRRLGAISKKGNSYLRSLLVQTAWTIVRTSDKSDPLHLWVPQLIQRRGKRIAVVALARRLVGVLWAMWRDGTVYDANHLARQGARGLRGAMQSIEQQTAALAEAEKKRSIKQPAPAIATSRRSRNTPAANAA